MRMELQQILAIIGALGVISSFVYAAVQLRRSTRALRAQTYLQLTTQFADLWYNLGTNAELCGLILRGNDDFESLDRVEKARFRFALMSYFRRFENAYFLHKIGILKDLDWPGIADDINNLFAAPGARAAWPFIRFRSSAEFQGYVQTILDRHAAAESHVDGTGSSRATAEAGQ